MLLTNLPVSDALEARMVIEWYRCRWEIETYFRVIKGSCNIEKSRLRSEDKKLNCIATYMIVAWRLHNMTMLSRRNPVLPCSVGFSEREWKLLWVARNKAESPKEVPSIYEMVRLLASLGGFLMRKGDGEPGVKTVWRGYKKLLHYIEAADILGV